jgi:release factor glutamine methyltransferase
VSTPHVADAVRRLSAAGVDSPRLDARVLWEFAQLGGAEASFESLVVRRAGREPLAYITGRKEFWSLDFEVGPGVLVPRPESETIIEQALEYLPDRAAPLNVVDFGVGSGCLLISFLKEFPNSHGLGVDLSDKAIAYASRNAARNDVAGRCEIRNSNWGDNIVGPCDVILANPPYIRSADLSGLEPEVSRFEPVAALDGGVDGLDAYRSLAPDVARTLRPGGLALVEIGQDQADDVGALMISAGLALRHIALDLAGIPRVLVTGRPG